MIPHNAITRVESYAGEAPCMFDRCELSATKIAHTTNASGSSGPIGMAIEVPYCDRHLDAVMTGRADEVAYGDWDRPADLDVGLLPLRVVGAAVALGALAFVYSPDSGVEWFVVQAALIAPIIVFAKSRIAAVASGAWVVYFWVPVAVWILTQLGILG